MTWGQTQLPPAPASLPSTTSSHYSSVLRLPRFMPVTRTTHGVTLSAGVPNGLLHGRGKLPIGNLSNHPNGAAESLQNTGEAPAVHSTAHASGSGSRGLEGKRTALHEEQA